MLKNEIYLQSIFNSPFHLPLIICYLSYVLIFKLILNAPEISRNVQKYPSQPQGRLVEILGVGGGGGKN